MIFSISTFFWDTLYSLNYILFINVFSIPNFIMHKRSLQIFSGVFTPWTGRRFYFDNCICSDLECHLVEYVRWPFPKSAQSVFLSVKQANASVKTNRWSREVLEQKNEMRQKVLNNLAVSGPFNSSWLADHLLELACDWSMLAPSGWLVWLELGHQLWWSVVQLTSSSSLLCRKEGLGKQNECTYCGEKDLEIGTWLVCT